MFGVWLRWLTRERPRPGRGRRRIGCAGCLLWIVAAVLLVLLLALVFGGFQHGTKAGLGPLAAMTAGYHP
ncbi:MAG TPA: hypothetical protein VN597_11985 [Streptosporangiaceae bacterium]|jgi:hypothetical protein|nr:hypothetical protein [Streptosporangiaceae bacterium]